MALPFYTAPSPRVVRSEISQILASRETWNQSTINLLKNLDDFAKLTAGEIKKLKVTRAQVQRALALEYGASDWNDLIYLCETMEHDDFVQISNRAKFLLRDHAAQLPIACVRLKKAIPELRRKSERQILNAAISLGDAQRVVAKEYGFDEWNHLQKFIRRHPSTKSFLNTPGAMPPVVAAMVEAVDKGDADQVERLINKNPSIVHARVASDITCGDTLLHRADPRATNGSPMKQGHLEVAQLLIDNGVDINAMGGSGDSCFTSPIDASSWIGNKKMVDLLLRNNADPNRSYWTMTKPVRTAANHNGRDIFRMLVKSGAQYGLYETVSLGFLKLTRELLDEQPEQVNESCGDSLPIVLAANDPKLTRLLLQRGADPNVNDHRGVTALMAAIQAGNKESIRVLRDHGVEEDIFSAIGSRNRRAVARMLREDPDCHKSKFVTPLIWAVISGDRAIVEMLLKAGANPNEQQRRWMQDNPLVAATAHQQDHLIQLLLDYGANVNSRSTFKWSIPLTSAVRWGTHRAARILLEAGANPSVVSDSGVIGNPMGWTGYVGDLLATKMMIDFGANKVARNQALISAAAHGRRGIIELLGTLDTDLHYSLPQGNAFQRAKSNRHARTVELLNELADIHQLPSRKRNDFLKPRADFMHFLCTNDGKSLNKLITQKPELVDRDIVRDELFHYATGNRQTNSDKKPLRSVVNTLVKHGVPWTIQAAVACNRADKVDQFMGEPSALKRGLHTAAKFNNVKLLELFLDAGADINVKESWGTALHEAVRYKSFSVVKSLVERGANVNATDQYGTRPRSVSTNSNKQRAAICDFLDANGASS
ncbi:MAG: ankyrin repeat domain-containing protein [Gammaproteobacteria bacterium]|nr:ankyrin repeat domain-containing protein [Gammaproteobacteria bacterium]